MSLPFKRALLLGGVTIVMIDYCPSLGSAQSVTALPEVVVNAPRPLVRRKPAAPARPGRVVRRNRDRAPAPVVAEAPPPQQGVLPIVTNQFATITVVPNDEIRRSGAATLGDLLQSKPGITGSSFAPGAASRPIIRGLDGNRVGIVENGTSAGGVSDLGEDHFVPIDPLATGQVDVIRGPAALRYGSTSIGGVVSASNNRIPEALPACAAPFRSYGLSANPPPIEPGCVNIETRTAISSVDRGGEAGVLLDAGGGSFAIHADVLGRSTADYAIPSYPYLNDPTRPFNSRQPNSAAQTDGASLGGSYIFTGGFIGAAITQSDALYHIPGLDGADHQTRIDAHQTRFTAKGEYRPDTAAIAAIRFWAGATDYQHNEIGLADIGDPASDGVRQTFTNKEQEAHLELQSTPFDARFAAFTSTFGAQAGHQQLNAPSPDNPGTLFNGLFSPNDNSRIAGYTFNEFKFSETTKAQIAGRIEHLELHGSTPNLPADFLPDGAAQSATERNPSYTPKSGSIGLLQSLPGDLVASVTAQYVERAPKPAELFSRGAHDATGTFDIGDPDLRIESAKSLEAGLRKASGPFRFEATAYYTRFNNFIYRRLTGVMCGDDFNSCGNGDPTNEGKQAIYSQRDAVFRGGEFQSQIDVGPLRGGIWGVENQFDIVRATFTDGSNVPRIPPVRAGGGLFWRDANWLMRVNLLHAFAQNEIAAIAETPTAGYNFLKAEISYKTALAPNAFGAREMLVGLIGNNLLNDNIRNSVSYNKDEVLMPGIGVRAFANVRF